MLHRQVGAGLRDDVGEVDLAVHDHEAVDVDGQEVFDHLRPVFVRARLAGFLVFTESKIDLRPRANYLRHELSLEERFPFYGKIHFWNENKRLLNLAVNLADVDAIYLVSTPVQGNVHIADVSRVAVEFRQRFVHVLQDEVRQQQPRHNQQHDDAKDYFY